MGQWIGMESHGVQTVAETPGPQVFENVNRVGWTDVAGLRQGWGVTFRGKAGAGCWFHSPIPSVGLFGHASAALGDFTLRFDAQGTARVTSVHLWCGGQRLKAYDGLSLSGAQDYTQLYNPELALPGLGVNVCCYVQFGAAASNVLFSGVYGRFSTP